MIFGFMHASTRKIVRFDVADFAEAVALMKAEEAGTWAEYDLIEGEDGGAWYRERLSAPIPKINRSQPGVKRLGGAPVVVTAPPRRDWDYKPVDRASKRAASRLPRYVDDHGVEAKIPHNWGNDDGDLFDHLDQHMRTIIREAIAINDLACEERLYG